MLPPPRAPLRVRQAPAPQPSAPPRLRDCVLTLARAQMVMMRICVSPFVVKFKEFFKASRARAAATIIRRPPVNLRLSSHALRFGCTADSHGRQDDRTLEVCLVMEFCEEGDLFHRCVPARCVRRSLSPLATLAVLLLLQATGGVRDEEPAR